MADVGDNINAERGAWTFSGDVYATFDQHVRRSVPFYETGHDLICKLSDFFMTNNSICYDLGASTGALTIKLANHNAHKTGTRFVGIDIEEKMVAEAKRKSQGLSNVEFTVNDVLLHEYEPADLIVAYYTVQFMHPSLRQNIFDLVYEKLKWGGAFIMFDKVRGPDARFQDILTGLYTDYKIEQGFDISEIVSKSKSLRGVLEPFSTQGNLDLLKRAGFVDYMTIMKYVCFEGFVAIK